MAEQEIEIYGYPAMDGVTEKIADRILASTDRVEGGADRSLPSLDTIRGIAAELGVRFDKQQPDVHLNKE